MTLTQTLRRPLIFGIDLLFVALAAPLSLWLRLGFTTNGIPVELINTVTGIFVGIGTLVVWFSKHDRISWRWISLDDALLLLRSALLINLFFLAAMFLLSRLDGVPRSLPFIDLMLLSGFFIGSRLMFRMAHEGRLGFLEASATPLQQVDILLLGVNDEAEAFIRKMARTPSAPYRVSGLIALNEERPTGSQVRGVKVLGRFADTEKILKRFKAASRPVGQIVIADHTFRGDGVRSLLDLTDEYRMQLSRIPELGQLQKAFASKIEVQPVQVEDLLNRPQADLDREAMRALVTGKRVLISGAGGSIGSELVRQTAAFSPAHLVLMDNSEFNLYEINRQIHQGFPDISREAIIADVRNRQQIEPVFINSRPELVLHAAALKHVPLLESQPAQAVLTNVKGTKNMVEACIDHNVSTMIMVSTDKATTAVSSMGASKRIAESICQSADVMQRSKRGTRFITVRFGNVLGSAGSVVPLFQEQLEAGGPLTVTHPEMTRYFMTIREAVELILQAATLRDSILEQGGGIVVLDMGEPVSILALANQMIRLAGLRPEKDIEITITGLRPGEKFYETLFQDEEKLLTTSHEALFVARPVLAPPETLNAQVNRLVEAAERIDHGQVRQYMEALVPALTPEEKPPSTADAC